MRISRRRATAVVGSLLFATAGCLDRSSSGEIPGESDDATEEFSITDLYVRNDRDDPVEATASVSRDAEIVFEESFDLDPGEARTYEDVMENRSEYEVTVTADGLSATERFTERRDDAGLEFSILPEKIESVEIVH